MFVGLGWVVQHVGPLELNQDGWLLPLKALALSGCNLLVGYGGGQARRGRAKDFALIWSRLRRLTPVLRLET